MNPQSVRYFIEKTCPGTKYLTDVDEFINLAKHFTTCQLNNYTVISPTRSYNYLQVILDDEIISEGKVIFEGKFFELLRYVEFDVKILWYEKEFENWKIKRNLEEV